MGGFLPGAGPLVVTVEADAPGEAVIRIVCDGRTITQTLASPTFSRALDPDEAGHACQAVVGWPGSPADRFVTWAVTNPIYLRAADPPATSAPVAATPTRLEVLAAAADAWRVEHAANAEARLESAGAPPAGATSAADVAPPVRLAYALAPGARAGQYAALVSSDVGGLSWAAWLRLRLSADRPMRVSIQLREPLGGQASRRVRSLVIGPEVSTHVVPMTGFRRSTTPAGRRRSRASVRCSWSSTPPTRRPGRRAPSPCTRFARNGREPKPGLSGSSQRPPPTPALPRNLLTRIWELGIGSWKVSNEQAG